MNDLFGLFFKAQNPNVKIAIYALIVKKKLKNTCVLNQYKIIVVIYVLTFMIAKNSKRMINIYDVMGPRDTQSNQLKKKIRTNLKRSSFKGFCRWNIRISIRSIFII